VPVGQSLLRISVTWQHTDEQVAGLAQAIVEEVRRLP
jgi:7-keto-8-aminopelargonate synthetase-like enzyme